MGFLVKQCCIGIAIALSFSLLSCVLYGNETGYLPKSAGDQLQASTSWILKKISLVVQFLKVENLAETIVNVFFVSSSYVPAGSPLHAYNGDMHLSVVACGDRLEEALVNIKSSLLFTKQRVFYHIFAEEDLHAGFKYEIDSWPIRWRRKFAYTLYPITYPSDGNEKNWKKLFKPCASQRLFLPLVLDTAVDSVLYVDTDIIFLADVQDFWNFFKTFNSSQLSSLCVEHVDKNIGWYNRFARHPYYGKTGVNSGVMLMNLTRIRKTMFKSDLSSDVMSWSELLLPLYNKYRYNITWGDQDLLNIIFHYNPELLHIFPCIWNYRPDHCMYGQTCKEARDGGVKILHGNRGVYHNKKQRAFRAVYETIRDFGFQSDYWKHIVEPLETALAATADTYCGKEREAILKGLRNIVSNMP